MKGGRRAARDNLTHSNALAATMPSPAFLVGTFDPTGQAAPRRAGKLHNDRVKLQGVALHLPALAPVTLLDVSQSSDMKCGVCLATRNSISDTYVGRHLFSNCG